MNIQLMEQKFYIRCIYHIYFTRWIKMAKKIKATLFISEDKREKIRRSGLSLEAYFNRMYDMFERFTMDRWIDGCFWINIFRVSLICSETFNFILDHFNEETLLRVGREVGENIQQIFKYGFDLEPVDDTSQRKILEHLSAISGWGNFAFESRAIIIKNPIFNKPFFLQGYLESTLNLKLKLIESNPDRMIFNILVPSSAPRWLENQKFEDRFMDFAEKFFDWVYKIDLEGRFTYASTSTERIFNYHPKEMIGKHFKHYFTESEFPKLVRAFNRCLKSCNIETLKIKMLRKDGSIVSLETYLFPIILNGEAAGVQGIAKDVTEHE